INTLQNLLQGYGGVPGIYTPYKIDLGGVLLGAIIGFGAVVVLPKLLHVISSPASTHPGYGRSVDEMTSGLVNIIDRVDFALHEQNINSTVCLERAFCQLLQSSSSNSITASLMGNTLLMSMIEGSRIKTILEHSRSPNGCDNLVMRCPLNQEVLTNGIRAIINI
ncbi:DM4/DM12 domain-containing protein Desiccate, partial [Lycorma delicatula]|uniref:DM4/DM12 domain-containing protein Desiccate n=1 Tax=Lycorma delicatula TaxID=130591 RepID=UPI003F5172C9